MIVCACVLTCVCLKQMYLAICDFNSLITILNGLAYAPVTGLERDKVERGTDAKPQVGA